MQVNATRGRPKGSTQNKKERKTKEMQDALSAATSNLSEALHQHRKANGPNARLAKTVWEDICKTVGAEYNIPAQKLRTKKGIAYKRIHCNNPSGARELSPVALMEPVLLEMVAMRDRMRQPLLKEEAIAFANSLISGSDIQGQLIKLHKRCGRSPQCVGKLGDTWYANFRRRYKAQLTASRPVAWPNRRAQWETHENFKIMYDETYKIWV